MDDNKALKRVEPMPEWRKQLSEMMSTWHFSIMKIEQFMVTTIESEIAKTKGGA